ncbi:uncharacterized protein LOC115419888 isoform X2 [Sphaeramia orbicularis]|uniref:uncharacterized protein LOC115419888 isoform X2 n=1 Tax=Sphaeramia orbicularis TaxID=375764 RepID=UPI0011815326|nr:uncharacterized protein LOC115419888 isoform X2 [Sphaeramia orbicularis]
MAQQLLLVVLSVFFGFSVQVPFQPELTVDPLLISETDSVTLTCRTPPSGPFSQCYFFTVGGQTLQRVSCLQTLTGSELLLMANQSSPAEVKVKCLYTVKNGGTESPSMPSDTTTIFIATLLPPKLIMDPPVITETDSVTLNCQSPSLISASQCLFYIMSGGIVKTLSCLQTLTGSELLSMAHQRSPAEVKMKCFYTVKHAEINSRSPDSDISSLFIGNPEIKPSVTQTKLTFSTSTDPNKRKAATEGRSVSETTLKKPTDAVEREKSVTQTTLMLRPSTDLSVNTSRAFTALTHPVKPTSGDKISTYYKLIWMIRSAVILSGIVVGVFIVVWTHFYTKWMTDKCQQQNLRETKRTSEE